MLKLIVVSKLVTSISSLRSICCSLLTVISLLLSTVLEKSGLQSVSEGLPSPAGVGYDGAPAVYADFGKAVEPGLR